MLTQSCLFIQVVVISGVGAAWTVPGLYRDHEALQRPVLSAEHREVSPGEMWVDGPVCKYIYMCVLSTQCSGFHRFQTDSHQQRLQSACMRKLPFPLIIAHNGGLIRVVKRCEPAFDMFQIKATVRKYSANKIPFRCFVQTCSNRINVWGIIFKTRSIKPLSTN